MSSTLWVSKKSNSANKNFYIKTDKENITMEDVMAQLRAMSTHLIKDWIIFVLMIYIQSLLQEYNLKDNFQINKTLENCLCF